MQVGCGADELIDLLMRCVLEPGDKIIDCPPTFTMYAFDAAVNNAEVVKVPRLEGFKLDVNGQLACSFFFLSNMVSSLSSVYLSSSDAYYVYIFLSGIKRAVAEHQPKIVFLTSPNNPDGSMITTEELLAVLDLPVLVVLDEAYIEFSEEETRMNWVAERPNLVVLRTFSKCAALAGLRVGYGAFPLDMIEYLWRAKQPYNVSVAAEVAAVAALSNLDYMNNVRDALVSERERLFSMLHEIPYLEPYPSASNFILCKVVDGRLAVGVRDALAKDYGIMVRHYSTKELDGYVRISVGLPEQTDKLLAALKALA